METAVDHAIPLYPIVVEQVPNSAVNVLANIPPNEVRTAPEQYTWQEVLEITGIPVEEATLRQRRWDKVKGVTPYPLQDENGITLEGAWLLCSLQAWCYDEQGPMVSHRLWSARYRELYEGKSDPKAPTVTHETRAQPYAETAAIELQVYRPEAVVVPSLGSPVDLNALRSEIFSAFNQTMSGGDALLLEMARQQGAALGAQMRVAKMNAMLETYTDLGQPESA